MPTSQTPASQRLHVPVTFGADAVDHIVRWTKPDFGPGRALHFLRRAVRHVVRHRRYLTTLKLANMALVNLQFAMKTERVLGRPYKLKIESTNICNTKCQLCPTGLGISGRPKGKMAYDTFTKLVDQWKHWLVALDLSMWGDPLIVPEIYNMIRYAHNRRIWTYISSNLHAFKPHQGQAEALVNSGLDLLTCSLHGASQDTYARYQPGKSFDDAVGKVRHIVETRNRMGSATPEIQLNFVVTRINEHEKEAFEQLARELGCKPVFSPAALNLRFLDQDKKLNTLGLAPDLLRKKAVDHMENWLPRDKKQVMPIYQSYLRGDVDENQFNGKKVMDCSWPWRQAVINWDGGVVTCCGGFDPSQDMGNVFEDRFAKIWNGKKYRLARRSFKSRVSEQDATNNPCAKCPGFMV